MKNPNLESLYRASKKVSKVAKTAGPVLGLAVGLTGENLPHSNIITSKLPDNSHTASANFPTTSDLTSGFQVNTKLLVPSARIKVAIAQEEPQTEDEAKPLPESNGTEIALKEKPEIKIDPFKISYILAPGEYTDAQKQEGRNEANQIAGIVQKMLGTMEYLPGFEPLKEDFKAWDQSETVGNTVRPKRKDPNYPISFQLVIKPSSQWGEATKDPSKEYNPLSYGIGMAPNGDIRHVVTCTADIFVGKQITAVHYGDFAKVMYNVAINNPKFIEKLDAGLDARAVYAEMITDEALSSTFAQALVKTVTSLRDSKGVFETLGIPESRNYNYLEAEFAKFDKIPSEPVRLEAIRQFLIVSKIYEKSSN